MTIDEFITYWNGKYCEVAGSPGATNQCVDLVNAYIRDVLGQPIIEWTNAVDFPKKVSDKYEYILNTPTGVPQKGDIMIWGGDVGHIGVFLEGDENRFTSFDQNYPTGSPCKVVNHTYLRPKVLGWLRLKKPTDAISEITKLREERDQNWNLYQSEIKKRDEQEKQLQSLNVDFDGVKQELNSYKSIISTYASILNVKPTETEKIAGELKRLVGVEDQFQSLSKTVDTLMQQTTELQTENGLLKSEHTNLTQERNDSRAALQKCIDNKTYKTLDEYPFIDRLLSLIRR